MLCKNCNYILTGKENFCPNCAAPLKEKSSSTEIKEEKSTETKEQEEIIRQEFIFPKKEDEKIKAERNVQIFCEPYEKTDIQPDEKKKSYAGRIMLLLFLTCAFTVGAFAVADYFDITSSVFSFIGTASTKQEEKITDTYNHESSIVKPDVSYSAETAYVMSGSGLTLRKGPDKSYAPVARLSDLTAVQIYGGSLASESWVYVYCAEKESYGWLDGSFLAKQEKESTTLFANNGNAQTSSDGEVSE